MIAPIQDHKFTGPDKITDWPGKLRLLWKPARYKVLWGGRGSGKSWGAARALLITGYTSKKRILCCREIQNSLADSSYKLLVDQVTELGLTGFYEITGKTIRGRNGTEFSFEGLRHNVTKIKSYEGIDICWVEEAQAISPSSWETLIPTLRKPGSEFWITFNPILETDETYQRFVINPPINVPGEPDMILSSKVNWIDNPWFPDVLRQEKNLLRERDPDAYLNVWEGHCRHMLDGAVYAKEMREALQAGRITAVPYDPTKPVHTFWDLGWRDHTSIWFAQAVGFDYHIIDFLQDKQRTIESYLKQLQAKQYVYGTDYLPHDAQGKNAQTGRSIEQLLRSSGRSVKIVPRLGVIDGINAARTIFANCYFDKERCADGINALRHYRYEVDPDTKQWSNEPLHDEHSDAADAFRYLALSLRDGAGSIRQPRLSQPREKLSLGLRRDIAGWMQ